MHSTSGACRKSYISHTAIMSLTPRSAHARFVNPSLPVWKQGIYNILGIWRGPLPQRIITEWLRYAFAVHPHLDLSCGQRLELQTLNFGLQIAWRWRVLNREDWCGLVSTAMLLWVHHWWCEFWKKRPSLDPISLYIEVIMNFKKSVSS